MIRAILEQFWLVLIGVVGHFLLRLFLVAGNKVVHEQAHFAIIRIGHNRIRKAVFLLFVAEALNVSLTIHSMGAR